MTHLIPLLTALAATVEAAGHRDIAVPQSGRLAFHSYTAYDQTEAGDRPLDSQIHLCDFPGETTTIIAEIEKHVRHALNPVFSHDGARLTFMALGRGREYGADWPRFLDLFVYDFRSEVLVNISKRAELGVSTDEDPIFSADGKSVIFKRNRSDLWRIDLNSFQAQALTQDGRLREESGPRISPDGKWLAYWTGGGATADVWFQPAKGGRARLAAGEKGIQEMFPAFLSNRTLAYTRWTSVTQRDDEIHLFDLITGDRRAAAFNSTNGANDSDPFAVEGLVGFSSDRSENGKGGWDLYLGHPDAEYPVLLRGLSTPRHDLGGAYTRHVVQREEEKN